MGRDLLWGYEIDKRYVFSGLFGVLEEGAIPSGICRPNPGDLIIHASVSISLLSC